MARVGRKTDLNLEELKAELDNSQSMYSTCLVLNEIGGLCQDGNKEAETFLCQQLEKDEPNLKFVAFCYLLTTQNGNPETWAKLVAFEQNPENKDIAERAREATRE